MNIEKRVLAKLEKCYSIAPLRYRDEDCFLVAAEKQDPCYLFNMQGEIVDTVWEGPGGVMSMVQVPGTDGQFLATQKFYSPNDSKEAKIVIVTPKDGFWEVHTLVELPHVHRFDILNRGGIQYLIACTLKSGHEYKDDWSNPGKIYVAELPQDLTGFHEGNQLELTVLKDQMLKNHGYYRVMEDGMETAVISADCGIFQVIPPEERGGSWEIRSLLEESASDAVLADLNQDGEKELCVLAPFHGPEIKIYEKKGEKFILAYQYENNAEFTHAIYGGAFGKGQAFIVGHRKGERDLLIFYYDAISRQYRHQLIDHDCGPANVYRMRQNDKELIISANRETNEIAMYSITDI
ncbi:MAG: hypothetical protein NC341_10075 [Blautia sp.]|nr:hypothetical protein [Blautia sp.]MCM1201968.1 hypothetical protein [Bacteroides fragilis]